MEYTKDQVVRLIREEAGRGSRPVIHPNGFIQFKTEFGRLHFWHPEIPRQKQASPIHDHVFNMNSEVIAGSVINQIIEVERDEEGPFDLYVAIPVDGANTDLVKTSIRVKTNASPSVSYHAGDNYVVPAGWFHETREDKSVHSGAAITLMVKTEEQAAIPRILIPTGKEPDNEFKRDNYSPEWIFNVMSKIVAICFDDFHEFELPGDET